MAAGLTESERERFATDGYLHLARAFRRETAEQCVAELFELGSIDPADPASWSEPVVRVPGASSESFHDAINTPRIVAAIDDLVGAGRWQPRSHGYGTFPIRFPSDRDPGDTGWHIDGSFGDPPNYRVNFVSKGRALLLLMLFTDVGADDAPTRIRVGSHIDVARGLVGVGDDGMSFFPAFHAPDTLARPVVEATGAAGDVYLCHPFLVHASSWPHRGTKPRVIGQPCIHHVEGEWLGGFDYSRSDSAPVELAMRAALGH